MHPHPREVLREDNGRVAASRTGTPSRIKSLFMSKNTSHKDDSRNSEVRYSPNCIKCNCHTLVPLLGTADDSDKKYRIIKHKCQLKVIHNSKRFYGEVVLFFCILVFIGYNYCLFLTKRSSQ